jgi:hypothetical protein
MLEVLTKKRVYTQTSYGASKLELLMTIHVYMVYVVQLYIDTWRFCTPILFD